MAVTIKSYMSREIFMNGGKMVDLYVKHTQARFGI
jgi:hypothetical protein